MAEEQPQPGPLASIGVCFDLVNQGTSLVRRNLQRVNPFRPHQLPLPWRPHSQPSPSTTQLQSLSPVQATQPLQQLPLKQLTAVRRLHGRAQHCLKPKGPGCNDRTKRERLMNVLTSLPFVFIGYQTMRERQTSEGRRFGAALVSVGAAATAYHATSGQLRTHLRKLDYWTIALSSTSMVQALFAQPSRAVRASCLASLAMTPFQPFAVSAVNTGIMEVEFARRAASYKSLRPAYRRHALTGGAGLMCFMLEDKALEHNLDFVHAAWHVLACCGVANSNVLMAQNEQAIVAAQTSAVVSLASA